MWGCGPHLFLQLIPRHRPVTPRIQLGHCLVAEPKTLKNGMGTWLLVGRGGKRGRNVVLEFELLHDRQVAALGLQPDKTGGRGSQQEPRMAEWQNGRMAPVAATGCAKCW